MIYEKLRALREDNDLSQKDIAQLLHISQAAYSKYELGQRDISIQSLAILADYYGTSVDYLIGRTEDKAKKSLTTK